MATGTIHAGRLRAGAATAGGSGAGASCAGEISSAMGRATMVSTSGLADMVLLLPPNPKWPATRRRISPARSQRQSHRGVEIGLKNQRDPGYSWRGLGT